MPLHMKPSKYDSTFGTEMSICLKKVGGWGCGSEEAPLITGRKQTNKHNEKQKQNKYKTKD